MNVQNSLLAEIQCEYCNGRGVVSIRAPQLNVGRGRSQSRKRVQAMRCIHCNGTGQDNVAAERRRLAASLSAVREFKPGTTKPASTYFQTEKEITR